MAKWTETVVSRSESAQDDGITVREVNGYRMADATGRVRGRVAPKLDEWMAIVDDRPLGAYVSLEAAQAAVEAALA